MLNSYNISSILAASNNEKLQSILSFTYVIKFTCTSPSKTGCARKKHVLASIVQNKHIFCANKTMVYTNKNAKRILYRFQNKEKYSQTWFYCSYSELNHNRVARDCHIVLSARTTAKTIEF